MASLTNGFGTRHFGKSNYVAYDNTEEEEFDTTLWFCMFWIPIVPIKSYRIRQKFWYHRKEMRANTSGGLPGLSVEYQYAVVKKTRINISQVCRVYITAGIVILLLFVLGSLINKIPDPDKIYLQKIYSRKLS